MLRFIIRRQWKDGYSGAEGEHFQTLDIDVPELQDALTAGGYGEQGFDMPSLVGVEVLPAARQALAQRESRP